MGAVGALIGTVATVLGAIGFLAAPVSIVWLIVLGEWWAVGIAALSLGSHFLLGLAMMPGMFLAALAATIRTSPAAQVASQLPHLVYTTAVVTVWCMGVFMFFASRATNENEYPLLMLAFSVGTAPFHYMISHEERSGGAGFASSVTGFFMSLAFVIVVLRYVTHSYESGASLWLTFAGIMAAGVAVVASFGYLIAKAQMRTAGTPPGTNDLV